MARDHAGVERVLHALAAAAMGAGLGVQIFLSFVVAPTAFQLVDRTSAGRLVEGLFPRYYAFLLAATGLALLVCLWLALRERAAPLRWGTVALTALLLAGTLYAGQVLLPQTQAARRRAQATPGEVLAPLEFTRLHRRAVTVNLALLVVSAGALAMHTAVPRR